MIVSTTVVPEYPKIETLFDRNPENMKRVVIGKFRTPEFEAVNRWRVTEKIDGTNIRIAVLPGGDVFVGGRTNDAQVPPNLMQYLSTTFTIERLRLGVLESSEIVTLYGEGYGPKIQGCGGRYRSSPSFVLFDVLVGNVWLDDDAVSNMAGAIGIDRVSFLSDSPVDTQTAIGMVRGPSVRAVLGGGDANLQREGIVARSCPNMLDRMGRRIMWKLKARDIE